MMTKRELADAEAELDDMCATLYYHGSTIIQLDERLFKTAFIKNRLNAVKNAAGEMEWYIYGLKIIKANDKPDVGKSRSH